MKTYFLLFFCIFFAEVACGAQICNTDSIPTSTPDSQLVDNGDGTVTDSKTGLMWKKCLEGLLGNKCDSGSVILFTWKQALQQPIVINNSSGFAGYADWRLPNIRELISIIEEQCYDPAINLNRFPNTPSCVVWSGSPSAYFSGSSSWKVSFGFGEFGCNGRNYTHAVRLVRGGQ